MLLSGINKIIQEYCYYKPNYLSDLEWWKPESMKTEFLEYLSNKTNVTFMYCDEFCTERLKHCDLDTVLCEECMNDVYTTYTYLYLSRGCFSCRNKKLAIYCDYCFREYCLNCRDKVSIDHINDPICESCSEKMKVGGYRSIIQYPRRFPDFGFLGHLEKSKIEIKTNHIIKLNVSPGNK